MEIKAVRLAPDMPSRKDQVYRFLCDYHDRYLSGPSLSAIAAACHTNKARVQDAIRKLEREQLVQRTPGKKGGTIPRHRADVVLRKLEALGYIINPPGTPLIDLDQNGRLVVSADTVTNASLPPARPCAHGAGQSDERDGQDDEHGGRRPD